MKIKITREPTTYDGIPHFRYIIDGVERIGPDLLSAQAAIDWLDNEFPSGWAAEWSLG